MAQTATATATSHGSLRLVAFVAATFVATAILLVLGTSTASAQTWQEKNVTNHDYEVDYLDPTGYSCGGKAVTLRAGPKTASYQLVLGTAGDDVILGTTGNDHIRAFGGNDIICGMGGADRIYGQNGDDKIWAGSNTINVNTAIFTAGETARSQTPAYISHLYGGPGNDVLNGSGSADNLFGEAGDDLLNGGGRGDNLDGGPGADKFYGGDAAHAEDTCFGIDDDDWSAPGACDRAFTISTPVNATHDNCWIRWR